MLLILRTRCVLRMRLPTAATGVSARVATAASHVCLIHVRLCLLRGMRLLRTTTAARSACGRSRAVVAAAGKCGVATAVVGCSGGAPRSAGASVACIGCAARAWATMVACIG
jgi:hypothetical protein